MTQSKKLYIAKVKQLIIIFLLLLSSNSEAQYTQIPDSYFEDNLFWLGIDLTQGDGQVLTANIDTVTSIYLNGPITDLTGIEDFASLIDLSISNANITSVDLSSNQSLSSVDLSSNNIVNLNLGSLPNLQYLTCTDNPLTGSGLNVMNCPALKYLTCGYTGLTSLDVSNHPSLLSLWCANGNLAYINISNSILLGDLMCHTNPISVIDFENTPALYRFAAFNCQLTNLDFSNNPNLSNINVHSNPLHCLNIKNGLTSFNYLRVFNTPNLNCIEVEDSIAATSWTDPGSYNFDSGIEFREYCDNSCSTGLSELSLNRQYPVKITDLLGRESEDKPNTTLIYIYSDGTTEKVYRIE